MKSSFQRILRPKSYTQRSVQKNKIFLIRFALQDHIKFLLNAGYWLVLYMLCYKIMKIIRYIPLKAPHNLVGKILHSIVQCNLKIVLVALKWIDAVIKYVITNCIELTTLIYLYECRKKNRIQVFWISWWNIYTGCRQSSMLYKILIIYICEIT